MSSDNVFVRNSFVNDVKGNFVGRDKYPNVSEIEGCLKTELKHLKRWIDTALLIRLTGKTRQYSSLSTSYLCQPWALPVGAEMKSLLGSWGILTSSPLTRSAQKQWETSSLSSWTGILTTMALKCRYDGFQRYSWIIKDLYFYALSPLIFFPFYCRSSWNWSQNKVNRVRLCLYGGVVDFPCQLINSLILLYLLDYNQRHYWGLYSSHHQLPAHTF